MNTLQAIDRLIELFNQHYSNKREQEIADIYNDRTLTDFTERWGVLTIREHFILCYDGNLTLQTLTEFRQAWVAAYPLDDAKLLSEAYTGGVNAANALTTGDVFLGAFPVAGQYYARDTPEFNIFVSGYLVALKDRFPKGVRINAETNKIVEDQS
jgi:hypothetical protein